MNLIDKPELLERLAAAHALGTLRGAARRRFETLARREPRIRATALIWQGRLSGLVELPPAVAPPPEVWRRIERQVSLQIDHENAAIAGAAVAAPRATAPATSESPGTRRWPAWAFWRGAGLGGAVAAGLAALLLANLRQDMDQQVAQLQRDNQAQAQRAESAIAQLANTQRVEYVAVLADDKSTASILVTFDPTSRRLTLKRVGAFQEAQDKSLQLWVIAPGSGPRSLGVLGNDPVMRLTAQERDVSDTPTLAISLEPKGGVDGAKGPTGPVLFKGAVLKTNS